MILRAGMFTRYIKWYLAVPLMSQLSVLLVLKGSLNRDGGKSTPIVSVTYKTFIAFLCVRIPSTQFGVNKTNLFRCQLMHFETCHTSIFLKFECTGNTNNQIANIVDIMIFYSNHIPSKLKCCQPAIFSTSATTLTQMQ